MQKTFLTVLFLILLSTAAIAETHYSTVIPDLPLMAGMTEAADHAVIFDKPAGRIVETAATGTASAVDIQKFYSEVLPPLGWKSVSTNTYIRDGERMTLSISDSSVQFKITPEE